MSHIHPISPEEANGEVRTQYNDLIALRGSVPNLFQLLGYSPKMLGPAIALAAFAGSEDSRVPARHKQLAYILASYMNKCEYCLTRHAVAAQKAGLTEAQIEAIFDENELDLSENPHFSSREKLIIQYSLELTSFSKAPVETIEAMKKEFDDEEYLELTYVIATANMFNRLADGLGVELEPEYLDQRRKAVSFD